MSTTTSELWYRAWLDHADELASELDDCLEDEDYRRRIVSGSEADLILAQIGSKLNEIDAMIDQLYTVLYKSITS